jgi:hypothetical protein
MLPNIHAADTENSRCVCACSCPRWHTNGAGLLAAAEVNWRAPRATESLAAISGVGCGRKGSGQSAGVLVGAHHISERQGVGVGGSDRVPCPKTERFRGGRAQRPPSATHLCTPSQPGTMLYEMIGVVCRGPRCAVAQWLTVRDRSGLAASPK